MTTRAIRINFLAPLVEPSLERIECTVMQDAGCGFDNNMRSVCIIFHIDDIRVRLAPFEVLMGTDLELRDGHTTLELILEIVHRISIQIIDGVDFGPFQEFREMLLGCGVHDGWRATQNEAYETKDIDVDEGTEAVSSLVSPGGIYEHIYRRSAPLTIFNTKGYSISLLSRSAVEARCLRNKR